MMHADVVFFERIEKLAHPLLFGLARQLSHLGIVAAAKTSEG
jgi:hypothetical protein